MTEAHIPKVSVCICTYNQQDYIGACLESIVSQVTDFKFEVIVGDDCSRDGTREVIMDYVNRYPEFVIPLFHKQNLGATQNYFVTHQLAKGAYIAHIDGDDLMMPGKLQKQADFLDYHPECAFVAHDVRIFDGISGATIAKNFVNEIIPEITDINYLLTHRCFFSHCSKMYKKSATISQYRDKFDVDFYIHVEHASMGKIGFINEVLGEYRKLPGTLSDRASAFNKEITRSYYDAYNRAVMLGVNEIDVAKARLLFQYAQAYSALMANDVESFQKLIILDKNSIQYASFKHRLFSYFSNFPFIVLNIIHLKESLHSAKNWLKASI